MGAAYPLPLIRNTREALKNIKKRRTGSLFGPDQATKFSGKDQTGPHRTTYVAT